MSNIWTQPETVPDNTTLASFILNYLLAKSSDKRELNHDLVMIEGKRSRKSKSVFNPRAEISVHNGQTVIEVWSHHFQSRTTTYECSQKQLLDFNM